MGDPDSVRPRSTVRRAWWPFDARDRPWLALALLPGVVAAAVYFATNAYPAYSAGLYAKIASEIVANGYALPTRIPGYTAEGVPFAYPPLQFYVYGVLLDLGGDPVTIARYLPSVATVAALVPTYLLGRDVADSRPAGAAAAGLVALNPQLLQWHLSAGGVVRAFAFLYAMVAISAGYRLFAGTTDAVESPSRRRPLLLVGALSFGATVLTHPTYTLFVVVSYLLFWLVCDRSVSGVLAGTAVGVGGAVLASPWLVWVLSTHGIGTFAAAAGTHGGVGGGTSALTGNTSPGLVLAVLPAAYLVVRREYLLPVWLVVAELTFSQPRFAYTTIAVLVPAAVVAFLRDRRISLDGFGVRREVVVALVLVLGTVTGGAYLAYETTLPSDPSTPEFLDDDAVDAMQWMAAETPPDARVVALGDAAEWLPALTDRTLLVGHWGVEWVSPEAFTRQREAYLSVSQCQDADCVERIAADVGAQPTHVYVPKGEYTILGDPATQSGAIERSFERAPGWQRVYENDGVVIYRANPDSGGPAQSTPKSVPTSSRNHSPAPRPATA